jgi:hypothetical protein
MIKGLVLFMSQRLSLCHIDPDLADLEKKLKVSIRLSATSGSFARFLFAFQNPAYKAESLNGGTPRCFIAGFGAH